MNTSEEGSMRKLMQKLKLLRDDDVIRPIDVELCRFLSDQHPGISKDVLLAAVMVSHLYRQGHVCLPMEDYAGQLLFEEAHDEMALRAPEVKPWRRSLQESPVVGSPGDYKPLIVDDANRIYMHKLWYYEHTLAQGLIQKSCIQVDNVDVELLQQGLERLFKHSTEQPDWQKVAAATSVRNKLSIISGGPGTGKTSTVVRILALILEQHQQSETVIDIALAAPTGKAAARLKNSIMEAREGLAVADEIRALIPENAQTLHQLLGARRHSARFRHDAENPIPYDLVIVDEVSMVDQALMSKLMEALLDDAHLILLGDKDQLASVEAGSVLGDICQPDENKFSEEHHDWLSELSISIPNKYIVANSNTLSDNITLLTKSYRFNVDSGIAQLSEAVNSGKADRAVRVLQDQQFDDVVLNEIESSEALQAAIERKLPSYFEAMINANAPKESLDYFKQFRILSAHRKGATGVENINMLAAKILHEKNLIPKYAKWYVGKPVIINSNDYSLNLYNGDIGICLADENGELRVYFEHEGEVRGIAPNRLTDFSTAYALTVHKSQGAEFDKVMLVLPRTVSKVLSRELIYTALTRARTAITILGKESILKEGIKRNIRRSSGLTDYMWHK
ncbi:exodeoxyribonuclease V subunit alpha [Fodinibius sp. Rm-B-1B1-1]|uniref:exodeoxyribonuclease V subunit alpha n=1 Tax=Fodinibius alkaliphilus TaxID=3140241 RepID=UPI00315A7877